MWWLIQYYDSIELQAKKINADAGFASEQERLQKEIQGTARASLHPQTERYLATDWREKFPDAELEVNN